MIKGILNLFFLVNLVSIKPGLISCTLMFVFRRSAYIPSARCIIPALLASKAGIMHLAEGMYADLRKTNIKVQLINPGFIETRLTKKNKFKMPFIMSADRASKIFFQFMSTTKFKKDFPFIFSLFFRIGRFLPNKIYFTLFK